MSLDCILSTVIGLLFDDVMLHNAKTPIGNNECGNSLFYMSYLEFTLNDNK